MHLYSVSGNSNKKVNRKHNFTRKHLDLFLKSYLYIIPSGNNCCLIFCSITYSVGTFEVGYLFFKKFASSGTLVLMAEQTYRPEADSFSATKIWARQTSSTCVIDIEPDNICIPFKFLVRNSFPVKNCKFKVRFSELYSFTILLRKFNSE